MIPRIRELLHSSPFIPFTIRTSDGREYTVPIADHAAINPKGSRVIVFTDDDREIEVAASDVAAVVEQDRRLLEKLTADTREYERTWNEMYHERFEIVLRLLEKDQPIRRAHVGQPGTMPLSVSYEHPLFRWHDSQYLWRGDEIYKSFCDGEWKLEAQGRFAGRGLNCGHYFARTPLGATAERITYEMSENDVLVRGDAILTNILDLTNPDNVQTVFDNLIAKKRIIDCGIGNKPWEMFNELMNKDVGGNWITNFVGRWAAEQGYAGILFFSSRAAALYREQCFEGRPPNLAILTFAENMWTIRSDSNTYCLVVFSGATLLDRCRTITVTKMNLDEETFVNPYFEKGEETIRALSPDFGEILGRVAFIPVLRQED